MKTLQLAKSVTGGMVGLAMILSLPLSVGAQALNTRPSTATPGATNKAEMVVDKTGKLQTKALAEIDRRLAILNEVLTKLSGLIMISTESKNTLISEVTQAISNLTVLRTQVTNSTEIVALRASVKGITDGYKTFGAIYPKMHLLLLADKQLARISALMELVAKIQSQTIGLDVNPDSIGVNGAKDVGTLIKVLDSAQTQLVGMKDKTNKAVTTLVAMKPTTSRNQLLAVRQTLASNNGELGKLIGLIRSNLGSLNKTVSNEGSASGAMTRLVK